MEKSLAILEYLTSHPEGVPLGQIAEGLNQLRSGCHRTLHELIRFGYVRQLPKRGDYALTTKLASMGLSFLSKSGVVDIAQPVINRLAQLTEELVRLAIVDGERMTLVAKAQGARSGLLYDPDMGIDLNLSCSAAGHAWLMTLPEDVAISHVSRQGLGDRRRFGPNAPATLKALTRMLRAHRQRGYSLMEQTYAGGMNSMAAPVRRRGEVTTGIVIVAGPAARLTAGRMIDFGGALLAAAEELAAAGNASPLLKSANVGTWGNPMETTGRFERRG